VEKLLAARDTDRPAHRRHRVFVQSERGRLLPHISPLQYPAWSLKTGSTWSARARVEIGSVISAASRDGSEGSRPGPGPPVRFSARV